MLLTTDNDPVHLSTLSGEQSMFGDSVALDGTSIASHDGKRLVTYTDVDLVRAGLSSPDHHLHTRSEILGELQAVQAITGVQSTRQIAKRIVKTDRLIRELVPEHTPRANENNQVTLFAAKEVNIQFDKRGGNTFENMRVRRGDMVSPRVEEGDHNPVYFAARSLASDSSVYHDGFQMKFHHHLRMHTCKLHSCTLIFAALRHHDFALMEHLCKQIKDSADIDIENIYGDTALTLACRLGKLNFIELLVQHAADINKETSNGRTGTDMSPKLPRSRYLLAVFASQHPMVRISVVCSVATS
jgi:ankyrin repeat protein